MIVKPYVRNRYRAAPIFLALIGALFSNIANASPLHFGDIAVATQSRGNVYVVNPTTGATTLISSGGLLFDPSHVLIDNQGRILTVERDFGISGIVRTDPATGAQTLLVPMNRPVCLAFDQGGKMVVGDVFKHLFRVDLQTGTQTALTTLGIQSMQDVDVDQQGRIVALDFGDFGIGGGKVVRFDPTTGQQTTIAVGGYLFNPSDLVITPSGDFLVANGVQLVRINPTTGAQSLVVSGPSFDWIALENDNTLVSAKFTGDSVFRVNLLTGQIQNVTSFHFSGSPIGIAVYLPEPSSFALAALGFAALAAPYWRRATRGARPAL